ncbi:hypothetical protein [Thermoclostridium caenicola]|nr:hypothetical protein [Thermoclostridium caenicola]
MKFEKTLYRREKGKRISVRTRLAFSGNAKKAYNTLSIIFFVLMFSVFIAAKKELIGIGLAAALVIALILVLIAVPLVITVKDKGKEAVISELKENMVKTVTETDIRYSVFGGSYDNSTYTEIRNAPATPTIIDETESK